MTRAAVAVMHAKFRGPYCIGEMRTIADDLLHWKLAIAAETGLLTPALTAYTRREL